MDAIHVAKDIGVERAPGVDCEYIQVLLLVMDAKGDWHGSTRKKYESYLPIFLISFFVLNSQVVAWCAVPIPFDDAVTPPPPNGTIPNDTISNNAITASPSYNTATLYGASWPDLQDRHNTSSFSITNDTFSILRLPSNTNSDPVEINFWFFLFFYFGIYNAIALLLITKIFSIYALNWWPKALGGIWTYCIFWMLSQGAGACIYFTDLKSETLTWVFLTFITMAMPLLVAFTIIRSQNRNVYRNSLTEAQKIFLQTQERRAPASYVRFLWFCTALFIALFALVAGEGYAYLFLATLPHGPIDALVYVYSWVGVIYLLDAATEYIIENKIRSYPLASAFKLYFFMIYFIFYRNLFARLRSIDQFALVQLASSLWVCFFYPLTMTSTWHWLMSMCFGTAQPLDEYRRKIGRSFYIRNLAENTTMIGFLLWVNILHFGPNASAYPYFQFDDVNTDKNPYTLQLTFLASLVVWVSELISAFVTRQIFKCGFNHSVTEEAVKDYERYPEMIVVFVLVSVHIMQDMLLALLKLTFQ
ncbi:hypothetical protein BC938DRAFT_482802 [Jimgerdemannia flammicorona]|uniref:Uncharacterized protein n=1 Tax=Jimgerdemannia flammicorona TaxID=994334 RepID=A0A433QDB7_9FUNG|nr:hypothetical protein BC938DRAFT_482802 [Jimgerdemannia flammicorona]